MIHHIICECTDNSTRLAYSWIADSPAGILVCAPSEEFQDEDCPPDLRPESGYNSARAAFEQEVHWPILYSHWPILSSGLYATPMALIYHVHVYVNYMYGYRLNITKQKYRLSPFASARSWTANVLPARLYVLRTFLDCARSTSRSIFCRQRQAGPWRLAARAVCVALYVFGLSSLSFRLCWKY